MSKNTRRVVVSRTVTYQTSYDVVGYPEETGANLLTVLGGAAGTTGQLALGELLSDAALARNGIITRADWTVVGTPINIESYGIRPQNQALVMGQRLISMKPVAGNEAALGKQFVVTTSGTTANVATEPTWNLTDGGTTVDGTATLRTLPKFPTLTNYAISTVYPVGTVLRPSAGSLKEFLVTTQNTSSASTPTWTSMDSIGATGAFQTSGQLVCIAGCTTFAFNTNYNLGDLVKPSGASSQEYLCITKGVSGVAALTLAAVGDSAFFGTAKFKRMV